MRVHGYTGADYRQALGLTKTRALAAPDISVAFAVRATARYRASPELRARFAPGQELARQGLLHDPAAVERRPEARRIQLAAMAAGRRTTAERRERVRQSLIAEAGVADLGAYLRAAYAAGASLDTLARLTQMGRAQLRAATVEAGVVVRPTGQNTPAGKRSRVSTTEGAAGQRVGADDVRKWLGERRAKGATISELARAVGCSTHWVRERLASGQHDQATRL